MKFWGELGNQGEPGPQGPAGADGADGAAGEKGWSPVFALEEDGDRVVLSLADWVGGTGTPPVESGYVGYSGFVVDAGDAVDVRGATGAAGNDGADGLDAQQMFYNIDDYGADPTGTVSSHLAINNAIASATNNGTKLGHVIFGTNPGSTYKVTTLPLLYSNAIIEGFGATLLNAIAGGSYGGLIGVQTGNSSTIFNENIEVRNLTLKGANNGKMWTLAQMKNCIFENVKFDTNGQVGQFTLSNTNIGVTFRRCIFDTLDSYITRFSDSTSEVTFESCIMNANGASFMYSTGSGVKNIEVRNCIFKEIGVYLAEIYSCQGLTFRRSRVVNSGANIGFGEIASVNSACINIDMGEILTENVDATFVNGSLISNGAHFQGPNTYNAAGTGATIATGGQLRVGRIIPNGGTALAAADVAVSAGWGATATKSITGKDSNGQVTVGAAGAGQAANPTITITFKDGTWGNSPRATANFVSGGTTPHPVGVSCTATTLVITPAFTPSAGTSYVYSYQVQGR